MSEAVSTLPKITPRHRRWLRRGGLSLLIVVGFPTAYYFYSSWSLHRDIERAIAETDTLDPRWRWEDIEADRKAIPDAENSAIQIVSILKLVGTTGKAAPGSHPNYDKFFGGLPAPAQLNSEQVELIREALDKIPAGLTEARKLKELPHGQFPVRWDPTGSWATFAEQQEVRTVCDILQHDAMLIAHFGDPDAAVESCLALLNATRSLENDPFLLSFHMRGAGDAMLVRTLERILAQGFPKGAFLKQMQERLRTERLERSHQWVVAVRGDRALFHRFFEPFVQGKKRWLDVTTSLRMQVNLYDYFMEQLPAVMLRDYPQHLRHRNELVATSQLPPEKQLERFETLEKSVDRSDRRKEMLSGVLPLLPVDLTNWCRRHLRVQALLGSTEVGLACERFRLTHKSWPESLAELVKNGFLDAMPSDPFDGQPLRFARLKDGVVIYSVGADKQDNGDDTQRDRPNEPGIDIGFRLWDPPFRRQPPRPPVALD